MSLLNFLYILKRYYRTAISRLRDEFWIFTISLLLQMIVSIYFIYQTYSKLPNGETTIIGVSIYGTILRSFLRSVFWATLIWCGSGLVKPWRMLNRVYTLVGIVLMLSAFLLEVFLLQKYQTIFSLSIAQILFGTNLSEGQEWLQTNLSASILILFGLAIVGLVGFIYLLKHFITRLRLRGVSLVFCISLALSSIVSIYSIPRTYAKVKDKGQAYDLAISPYDRILWNSYGVYLENKAIKRVIEGLATIRDQEVRVISQPFLPPRDSLNVVVIIGETLRRDYLHCYGFPLNNTPQLDSIIATGDMIAYSDVVSPAASTIESLTKVLTFQTNNSGNRWYDYPVLTSVVDKAGYNVNWLSNQESSGVGLQSINIFAKLSDQAKYVNTRSIDEEIDPTKIYYDGDILPHLKSLDNINIRGNESGFIQFVHLMGSHPIYKKRFPENYAKFYPKDIPIKRSKEKDQIVADYINSVYYNDYVVSSIIKYYSAQNSMVIYFSDHGEIIYDDPQRPDYCDHGPLPQGVSVPFLVYLSPQLRRNYPELYEKIKAYKDRKIMLDLFTHSLTALLGIQTQYSDPKLDFFSDEYDEGRIRVIDGFGQKLVL